MSENGLPPTAVTANSGSSFSPPYANGGYRQNEATLSPYQHLSRYLYYALAHIHSYHPHWLKEKYRHYNWKSDRIATQVTEKLATKLQPAQDTDSVIETVLEILQFFFIPRFFLSTQFAGLLDELRQVLATYPHLSVPPTPFSFAEISPPHYQKNGTANTGNIALLLLDAENFQISPEEEQFLNEICQHTIHVKIAFAHWQGMGKKDAELHKQGYQLVHVPSGKDSADVKMASVGASIFLQYPNAQEIFVCSCDGALTHLSNTLNSHGLTVYQVQKQGKQIAVYNSKTGEHHSKSWEKHPDIDTPEKYLQNIGHIVRNLQERNQQQWVALTAIAETFVDRYKLALETMGNQYFPNESTIQILSKYANHLVVYQPMGEPDAYVTVFERATAETLSQNGQPPSAVECSDSTTQTATSKTNSKISSPQELEKMLQKCWHSLEKKQPGKPITPGKLGVEFRNRYREKATTAIVRLGVANSLQKFLAQCPSFILYSGTKEYYVAIAATYRIESPLDLEKILINLCRQLIETRCQPHSPKLDLSTLAAEFNKQYQLPLTKILKHLNLPISLPRYLQSCDRLSVEKYGKSYLVYLK